VKGASFVALSGLSSVYNVVYVCILTIVIPDR